jgi:integrase
MKIPAYPGHGWEITARTEPPEARPLKVAFAKHRAGLLDGALRKHPGAGPDSAAPWYLRTPTSWRRVSPLDGPPVWTPDGIVAAIRNALDHLTATSQERDPFARARARVAYRANLTLAKLSADWLELGMPGLDPDSDGAAFAPRSPAARAALLPFLETALKWWGSHDPAAVTQRTMRDYHASRCAQVAAGARSGQGKGSRAVDLELNALAQLCRWAVADERLGHNPFAQRPRFRSSKSIVHCHAKQPDTDEELHQLARHLFGRPAAIVSGARLLFAAMTGLRPGEHGFLQWNAQGPSPKHRAPGEQFTDANGRRLLAVQREKHGINPGVEIHATLGDFLDVWRVFTLERFGAGCPWMFPNNAGTGPCDSDTLSRDLLTACAALGLPPRTGHAARAYYVSVRRSQGLNDSDIASHLGHRSGEKIVVRIYGDPGDIRGTGRLDWLPADGTAPAWELLRPAAASNLVAFAPAADTLQDTSDRITNRPPEFTKVHTDPAAIRSNVSAGTP